MTILNRKVTVLMPVFNGGKYVKEAIDSILNQTFNDFHLLVIDDGSTDNSVEIINQFNDDRLVFIQNEKNKGIVGTLNRGLSIIDSQYIARMDADDVAYPNRLEKQVKYMENNLNVAASGTSVLVFNDKGAQNKLIVKDKPEELRTELLFKSPLMHPTVILRNESLKKYNLEYNSKYIATEDYGLWQKIVQNGDLGNIKDILLKYRDNESGISHNARKKLIERDQMHLILHREYLNDYIKAGLSDEEIVLWRKFNTSNVDLTYSEHQNDLSNLIKKVKKNLNKTIFDIDYFNNRVSLRYRMNLITSGISSYDGIKLYKNKFSESFNFNIVELGKFLIKNKKNTF